MEKLMLRSALIMMCLLSWGAYGQQSKSMVQEKPVKQPLNPYWLFFNSETGDFSSYSGAYTLTTKKAEEGQMNITSEGPISWKVNPSRLSISPNQTETWTGSVSPNVAKLKQDKLNEASATMVGEYIARWSMYDPENPRQEKDFSKIGYETAKFSIYDVNIEVEPKITIQFGKVVTLRASNAAYRNTLAGVWSWSIVDDPDAIRLVGETNQPEIKIEGAYYGKSAVKVTYEIAGLKSEKFIKIVVRDILSISVPEVVELKYKKAQSIYPLSYPNGGVWNWKVIEGKIEILSQNSETGLVKFIAMSTTGGIMQVKYTLGGETVTKVVQLNFAEGQIVLPDSFFMFVGDSVSITPNYYPQPSEIDWTLDQYLAPLTPTNQQSIRFLGRKPGISTLRVDGKFGTKSVVERMSIQVFDQPTLSVESSSNNGPFCETGISKRLLGDNSLVINCKGYPYGGTYSIEAGSGILVSRLDDSTFKLTLQELGRQFIVLRYNILGRTAYYNCQVQVVKAVRAALFLTKSQGRLLNEFLYQFKLVAYDLQNNDISYLFDKTTYYIIEYRSNRHPGLPLHYTLINKPFYYNMVLRKNSIKYRFIITAEFNAYLTSNLKQTPEMIYCDFSFLFNY